MRTATVLLAFLMLAGCGCDAPLSSKGGWGSDAEAALARNEMAPRSAAAPAAAIKADAAPREANTADGTAPAAPAALAERKIVYTGHFTLLVTDLEKAQAACRQLADANGGYLQELSGSSLILRVPAGNFEKLTSELGKVGGIAAREIRAQDVTEQCVDLEIRIRNTKALQDHVRKLLEKNADLKYALELEQELARLTTQLEQLETALKNLEKSAAFAAVHITFSSPARYSPPQLNVQLPFDWLHTVGLSELMRFGGKSIY